MVVRESLTKEDRTDAADQQVRMAWVELTEQDAAESARESDEHSFKFPDFAVKVEEAGSNRQMLEGAQGAYSCSVLDPRDDEDYCARLPRIVEVSTASAGEATTIEDSTASADSSATALAGVIEAVGELAQENNTLADRMREQSKGAMEQIDSATAAAEQTAASSQQVSAGAEEVTARVGEIAAQALGLSNIATELNEFLDWIGAARSAVAQEEKAA